MARTAEEIISGLSEIVEEVTGIEPEQISVDKSFVDDLDIDSLSMVEIAVQTEDRYGVEIPDEDLAKLRTVGDAVEYIQKLDQGKTPPGPIMELSQRRGRCATGRRSPRGEASLFHV